MAEPTITLGTTSKFGSLTGWVPNSATITTTKDRAVALDGMGDEIASALHNSTTEYTQEFVAAAASAPTVPPTIGALVGSCILTSIQISTSASDFVKMTLTGHQHADNAHANTLRQKAHGITLSSGFGAQDFLGGTAGENACVESSTITISVDHTDDVCGATGNHYAGNNHTGKIEASTTWIGTPSEAAGSGWGVVTDTTTEANTARNRKEYSAVKGLTLANPD